MKYDVLHHFISPMTGKVLIPEGKFLIGDNKGFSTPILELPLANLPKLYTGSVVPLVPENIIPSWIPTGGFLEHAAGKIYRGSSDGSIISSDDLTQLESNFDAFRILYYAWRSQTNFIGGEASALGKALMTKTQWLSDLDDAANPDKSHILKSNTGIIARAIAGTDYVDTEEQRDEAYVSLLAPNGDKLISTSSIRVIQGIDDAKDNIRDINSISLNILQAANTVTSEDNIIARNSVETRKVTFFDYNAANRYTKYVALDAPALVEHNITWKLPKTGENKQILTLENGTEWKFKNVEDVDVANKNATYITKTKHDNLPNSIALKDLVGIFHPNGGLLKIDGTGTPAIAKGGSSILLGDDYLTPANYDELDGKIDALGRGLAQAIETQVAVDVVLGIAELLGFASQVASNYRLNELRDQTILLKEAGDLKNTFKTRYNVIFDNNESGGTNVDWEYGVSLLAEDSSLTETFGNDIRPIYFRIGGKSNFITAAQSARYFALQVDFVNDGTKERKWHPKKLSLFLGQQDYVRDDRQGYDTTKGHAIDEIADYDVESKQFTFHQKVETKKLKAAEQFILPILDKEASDYQVKEDSMENGAMWLA